jgi:hypothetical protein
VQSPVTMHTFRGFTDDRQSRISSEPMRLLPRSHAKLLLFSLEAKMKVSLGGSKFCKKVIEEIRGFRVIRCSVQIVPQSSTIFPELPDFISSMASLNCV